MSEEMGDFPAAHSMDSVWWAVDEDGCLAEFWTGEAGALPLDAPNSQGAEISDALSELVPRAAALHDLEGYALEGSWLRWYRSFPIPRALVVTAAPELAEALLTEPGAERVPTTGRFLGVVLAELGEEPATRLDADPRVAAIRPWYSEPGAASLGFYEYNHVRTENAQAGPYDRRMIPTKALRLEMLPDELARRIERCRLPLRFADTPAIQPVSHRPCRAWNETLYVDAEGLTQPWPQDPEP